MGIETWFLWELNSLTEFGHHKLQVSPSNFETLIMIMGGLALKQWINRRNVGFNQQKLGCNDNFMKICSFWRGEAGNVERQPLKFSWAMVNLPGSQQPIPRIWVILDQAKGWNKRKHTIQSRLAVVESNVTYIKIATLFYLCNTWNPIDLYFDWLALHFMDRFSSKTKNWSLHVIAVSWRIHSQC
jgi:hypothetical protein